MKRLILSVMLLTAACAGKTPVPEPIVTTVEVKVPVPMPCVPSNYSTIEPDYADSDVSLRGAADAAERYQRLWAGRAQRIARDREKTIVIAGCPRG